MLSIQRLSKKICGETVVQGIDFNVSSVNLSRSVLYILLVEK